MLCESSYDYEVPHRDWQLPLLLAAVGRWGEVFPTRRQLLRAGQ